MTIGDLKQLIATLPDHFPVNIETNGATELIRSVSLENISPAHNTGRLVLRSHMLTIGRVVETFTAHDGSEYVIAVERVNYPTVIQMNVNHQVRASLKRLSSEHSNDAA